MSKQRKDDPDETEGRALYRAQANALAHAQVSYARRNVKLSDNLAAQTEPQSPSDDAANA